MKEDCRYYTINDRLLSPMSYNFFGDLNILVASGRYNIEDVHKCIQDVYTLETWNVPKPTEKRVPPMYNPEAEEEE